MQERESPGERLRQGPWIWTIRMGVIVMGLAGGAAIALPGAGDAETDPSASLARLLGERHGLVVDTASIHWIDPPRGGMWSEWSVARAALLARTDEESLRDLYLVRARLAPSGRALAASPTNLTQSWNASEQALVARGPVLALGAATAEGFEAVEVFDFGGEDPGLTSSWPLVERIKARVTSLQETGQWAGVSRIRYEMIAPSSSLGLEMRGDDILVGLDGGMLRVGRGKATPAEGADLVTVVEPTRAMSGHVGWLVDTARAIPFIGKEKIGWLESRFYRLADLATRAFYRVAGARYAAREIEEDLELDAKTPYVLELPKELGAMDLGWPPGAIPKVESMEPVENEGKWAPMSDERFTRRDQGHPYPIYKTFIRPDPEREYATMSLVAWDPRMVEIHMQAGVVEPRSDTGKAGTGMIPRDDGTLLRLVAAFNGGFQALHGEFGMMQEGKVYLPPKPWAATVARLRGGRIAFGTWPGPDVGDIPPEILSFRQNLTPLVQDGETNPYKRHWWGSSPDLNPDSPMIVRSGICWTSDDHVLYGLAQSVNEITFAEGLRRAGCHYVIQLDVNAGHSGFEYYRVDPSAGAAAAGEIDEESEAEGEVRGRPDLLFRARKLYRSMTLMRFPRFIDRDPRDFFYLTLAHLLPGPAFAPPGGEPQAWRVEGLPGSTTYPAKFAMATIRTGPDPVHVVQADPRWLDMSTSAARPGATWFPPPDLGMYDGSAVRGALTPGDSVIAFVEDEAGAEWAAVTGRWQVEIFPADVSFAFKVVPEEGFSEPLCGAFGLGPERFISWAETPGGDPGRLAEALRAAGAGTIVGVPASGPCGWAFSYEGKGLVPLVVEELRGSGLFGLAMAPADRSAVERIFPATTIVKPGEWNPGQTKRIRYFRPEEAGDSGQEP